MKEPTSYELAILRGMQEKPASTVAQRRAANKIAGASRRKNRVVARRAR